MKVLSLFDGISCGMVALERAKIHSLREWLDSRCDCSHFNTLTEITERRIKMRSDEMRIRRRLRELEALVHLQLVIIIVLFIGFCAFAANTHNAIQEGVATIQAIEVETYSR